MSVAHSKQKKKSSTTASAPPEKPVNKRHFLNEHISNAAWDEQKLHAAYDPEVPAKWRQFLRWQYSNPDIEKIPSHFAPLLLAMERNDKVAKFKVRDQSQSDQLAIIKDEIEKDIPARNQRREQELLLADYIDNKITPLGPIEFVSAGALKLDYPEDIVLRLRECRQNATIGRKPSGGYITIYDSKCGYSKLCPDESRAESQRISESYIPAITSFLDFVPGGSFQYAVFTLKNFEPGELAAGKKEISLRFAKLLKTKCMAAVTGCLSVQEDPLSIHGDWNVHINVMMIIDGHFDWAKVRAAWDADIEFIDEKSLYKKTRANLEARGIDTSGMDRTTVLSHAFRELAKYAGAPISIKGELKHKKRLTKAPLMSEWPAVLWREWWSANKNFRRTRSYGQLFDPEGYRWLSSKESQRLSWLKAADISTSRHICPWRKTNESLTQNERIAIRDVMCERELLDLADVVWVGTLRYSADFGYRAFIGLVPEDKFVFVSPRKTSNTAPPATGPPD